MHTIKKYMLMFLVFHILGSGQTQATVKKYDTYIWEDCLSFRSAGLITSGFLLYNLITTTKDLNFQSVNSKKAQDALKNFGNMSIYYPGNKIIHGPFQKLSNQTERRIITLHEQHINRSSLILLFAQAIELSPCIVYIEKTSSSEFASYNHEIKTAFIKEMLALEKAENSIVVLGHAKGCKIESVKDITSISFDIKNENPSYQERVEFLNLLLTTQDAPHIDIQSIAKKIVGFSYKEIIDLINKANCLSKAQRAHVVQMHHIEEAYTKIAALHAIKQSPNIDLHRTSIHEIGHALTTILFSSEFILHNVTTTPQSNSRMITLGSTQATRKSIEHESQLIPIYEHSIMILLAGRIAEQIVFGLPHGEKFNTNHGYNDFMQNPLGAQDDLLKAKTIIHDILCIKNNNLFTRLIYNSDENILLRNLYIKTVNLIMPYKNKIEEIAKELEEQEFLPGSHIYKRVYGPLSWLYTYYID